MQASLREDVEELHLDTGTATHPPGKKRSSSAAYFMENYKLWHLIIVKEDNPLCLKFFQANQKVTTEK